jgi:ribonucleotide reductase alpha subunit
MKIQEAAQRYIDSAISKTINLPKDFKQEDLSELMLKYITSIKGLTVYRDGSKFDQPLTPVDFSKYEKRSENADDVGKAVDCASGTCDL